MIVKVETKIKTRVIDAKTKQVLSESPWRKNLVMDGGLNGLARSTNSTYPAEFAAACRIGDGTTPVSTASGAITFTQSGTTITASAGFFTVGMVGQIFKYGTGTGGAEYYITAFTDSTHVTVDTSATVGTPTVATVWAVNQTTMANLLFTTATYETTAGSCGTTFSANQVSHKRTYNFAQQASSYNVNEIGYFRVSTGTTIFGRLVLPSTDVVPNTSFYQVILTVTFTYSPSTPTAVGNVGTNIDTSGNAMLEVLTSAIVGTVNSNGTSAVATTGQSIDGSATCIASIRFGTYTQNNPTSNSAGVSWGTNNTNRIDLSAQSWAFASSRGKMTLTNNQSISTAGQTMNGIGLMSGNNATFDVKFTTGFTLPTGTFLPQTVWSQTYNRTLTN